MVVVSADKLQQPIFLQLTSPCMPEPCEAYVYAQAVLHGRPKTQESGERKPAKQQPQLEKQQSVQR